ncbi:MAG: L-serine ammonia-lyase, iron-sulfur-dependent, subunit alpha, partial [Coriobacteriia bacterium]|nr:L-serine ammonia-lyase, iron-sulfur-dependent, subunit alpha [Coriobacteriia bacterium]
DRDVADALITASAIGAIIASRATLSGAAGGCQAEIGSAAAMAAAAVTELLGGTADQCGHAASLALQGLLGLVCDPVGGLVEVPCVARNATGAAVALSAAEMALAGVKFPIPFDQVVDAAAMVGRSLPPSLKETAAGGLAVTPEGRRLGNAAREL